MSYAHYSTLLRTEGSLPTRGVSVRTSLTIEQIEDDAHSPKDPHIRSSRRNSDAGDGKYSDIKHKYFSRLKLGAPEAGRVKPIIVSREQEVTLNGDEPQDEPWHPHAPPPGEIMYGSSADIKTLQPFSASFSHHSMPQPVPYNFSNNSPPIAIPVREQLVKRGVEVSGRVSRKNSTVIPTSLPFSPPKDSVPPSALAAQIANLDIGSGVLDSTDADSIPLSRNATSSAAPEPIASPYSPLTSPSPSVYSRRLGPQAPTAYSGYGEPTGGIDSTGLPLDYSARFTDMLAQSTASNTPSTATSAQSRGVRTHSSPSMFRGGLPAHPTAPLQHSSHVRMNERDRDRDVDLFDFEPEQGNEYFEEPVPVKPTKNFEDYFRS